MQQNSIKRHIYIARGTVFFGAILAAFVSLTGQGDLLVLQPLIGLLITSLLLGLHFLFKSNILLRLVLAFFAGILVNQAMLNSFELTVNHLNVTLYWHFPVLLLFFAGFYAFFGKNLSQFNEMSGYYLIAGVLVSLHMVILFVLLTRTFGLGYENSLQVLANIVIFSIFFIGLIVLLAEKVIFMGLSIIMVCYFLAIMLVK